MGSGCDWRANTRNFTAVHNNAVIRVYDDAGNVIETHEHAGDFREF
jgi:hypothetical protein